MCPRANKYIHTYIHTYIHMYAVKHACMNRHACIDDRGKKVDEQHFCFPYYTPLYITLSISWSLFSNQEIKWTVSIDI